MIIVGGGNSAGQAAVFLASHAHVHVLIRAANLDQSMSRYLIERVTSLPNVTIHAGVDVTALDGAEGLEEVRYRCRDDGNEVRLAVRHVFLFTGAESNTGWLSACGVSVDSKGFVLTGTDVPGSQDPALPLQTSAPGVFAIGDVRAGSIKRVAAAVGEGAAAIAQIHRYLDAH